MHRPRNKQTYMLLRGLFVFLLPTIAATQPRCMNGISLSYSYIADAQIFTSPASPDPEERTLSTNIGAGTGISMQYRRELLHAVFIESSLEYATGESMWTNQYGTELTDGYRAYILELSGLFALPFSGRVVRAYVGGGGGLYLGDRLLAIGSAVATTTSSSPVFGIHVLLGAEWHMLPNVSLRGDARFRDPQMSVHSGFSQSSVESNGIEYPLPPGDFPGAINLNGNVYSIGVLYSF